MNVYRDIDTRLALEREYSPSSCVSDVAAILADYARRSGQVRQQLERIVKSYGEAAAEQFDYFPAPATRQSGALRPVLIYLHGGYWQELSKDEHSFPAAALHSHDVGYIAANYGLAPPATLGEMLERCRRAVVWIVKHSESLKIDPRAVHLAGCSAGAHLAAMTALTDWSRYGVPPSPLRSLTLLSGVFDLRPLLLTYINDALAMSAADSLLNSPLLLIDSSQASFPPTLIVWGDNETAEFKRQSREFAASISRKGVAVHAEEIAGRNHFDLLFDLGEQSTRFGALTLEHLLGHRCKTMVREAM